MLGEYGMKSGYSMHFLTEVFSKAGRLVLVSLVASLLAAPAHVHAKGPDTLANLADQVIDAVVNISASTNAPAEEQRSVPMPQLPPGSPFQDFFEEFLGPKGENGQKAPQRRSSSLGSGFVIDASGKIVKEWRGVKVPGHVDEVLEIIEGLA